MKREGHLARLGKRETHFWWGNLKKGNVARVGEKRVLVGKPEGKRPFGKPRRSGKIIRWIFRKRGVGALTGSIWLRIGRGDGHL